MILRTYINPKPDRDLISELMRKDLSNGADALVSMLESRDKKVSPIERYKKYNPLVGVLGKDNIGQQYTNNFQDVPRNLKHDEVDHLVQSLGKRYPCLEAWVCTTFGTSQISEVYSDGYGGLRQNNFLPCPANVFSYSCHGIISMSVNAFRYEDAEPLSKFYDPNDKKQWSYCHVVAPLKSKGSFIQSQESLLKEIKAPTQHLELMIKDIRGSFECSEGGDKRINLTPPAKKHYKKFGYVWNKQLSQQRATILDKVSPNGNIVRISADGGGFGTLTPYVEVKMIGYMQETKYTNIVPINIYIHNKDDLDSLLEKCSPALEWYERNIVPKIDANWGVCPDYYREILIEHGIREIVWA